LPVTGGQSALQSGNTDLGLQRLVGSHFVPVPFTYPIDYSEVTQFIADPGDPRTIYFGLKYVCPGSCLQKSIDGGATWAPTGQGIVCQVNDALVVDPQRPGTLYAAANTVTPGGHLSCEGVFRTTDGGATWDRIETGLHSTKDSYGAFFLSNFDLMTMSADGTLYLVSNLRDRVDGLFASSDGGTTWTQRAAPALGPAHAIAADPHAAGAIWLLTASGLYRSADGAASWQNVSPTPSFPTKLTNSRYSGFGGAIVISPITVGKAFTTDGMDVFETRDDGQTWTNIRSDLQSLPILSMTIDHNGAVYVGTAGSGVSVWEEPRRRAVRH